MTSYLEPALTAGPLIYGYRPDPSPSSNKDRLYIAYYTSRVRHAGDPDIDTALLLAPKNPQDPNALQSWRFGVSRHDLKLWTYASKRCRSRSSRLRALLFLGKVGKHFTGETLAKLLANVFVVQHDEAWGSSNWTKDAVQTLIEHEVIAPMKGGAGAREVWEKGFRFSVRVKNEPKKPVPTCDQRGKAISPEIR